jgi:hypothetical protein
MEMQAMPVSGVGRRSPTRGVRFAPARASAARPDTLLWLSAIGLLGLGHPLRMSSRDQDEATTAALSWLALVDARLDDLSWREAGRPAGRAARGTLGWCVARRLRSRVPVEAPAEAPRGPYVVLRFESTFEGSGEAVETVMPALGADGRWRVASYFIETKASRATSRSGSRGRRSSRCDCGRGPA